MKEIKQVAFEKKEKTNCFIALELLFHPVILILNFQMLKNNMRLTKAKIYA